MIDKMSISDIDFTSLTFNNHEPIRMEDQNCPEFKDILPLDSGPISRTFQDSHWGTTPPEQWSCTQTLDWLYDVAKKWNRESEIAGERFRDYGGTDLCSLTENQFCQLEPNCGAELFRELRSLIQSANQTSDLEEETWVSWVIEQTSPPLSSAFAQPPIPMLIGSNAPGRREHHPTLGSTTSYPDIAFTFDTLDFYQRSYEAERRRSSSESDDSGISYGDDDEFVGLLLSSPTRPNNEGGGRKTGRLWYFLLQCLQDQNLNPEVIKWENKREGVFRIVSSSRISQEWGRRKNSQPKEGKGMNWEKMSRAIRYCQTSGVLKRPDGNSKYPKKLCFMFGPKAHGWQHYKRKSF